MAKKADKIALEFLIREQVRSLPVNAIRLANKRGYQLYAYSGIVGIMEKMGYNYDDMLEWFGHAFATYDDKIQAYIIACDMECDPVIRNWAILHEIAHIEQNHITKQRTPLLKERTLINEISAERFVHMVLCPDPVLNEIGVTQPEQIENVCLVPEDKAIQKSRTMQFRKIKNQMFGNPTESLDNQLKKKFSLYIQWFKHRRKETSEELFPYQELAEFKKRIGESA